MARWQWGQETGGTTLLMGQHLSKTYRYRQMKWVISHPWPQNSAYHQPAPHHTAACPVQEHPAVGRALCHWPLPPTVNDPKSLLRQKSTYNPLSPRSQYGMPQTQSTCGNTLTNVTKVLFPFSALLLGGHNNHRWISRIPNKIHFNTYISAACVQGNRICSIVVHDATTTVQVNNHRFWGGEDATQEGGVRTCWVHDLNSRED